MKATKNVMSALLGVALLAMPVVASAHPRDDVRNRGPLPAYQKVAAFQPVTARPVILPRRSVISPIVSVRDRDDWRRRDRDDRWKHGDRDDWRFRRGHDRDDCPPPRVNTYDYRNGYQPNYYQRDSYDNAPQYQGAASDARLAALIHQRDNAVNQYRAALRRRDNVAAKHLANDIEELNKRIASVRRRLDNSYRPVNYNSYAPSASNNAYGTPDALTSMVAPLIGNIY